MKNPRFVWYIRPESCPEQCPNFWRFFVLYFLGEETTENSPGISAVSHCKLPRQVRRKIHKISLESRQCNTVQLWFKDVVMKETRDVGS